MNVFAVVLKHDPDRQAYDACYEPLFQAVQSFEYKCLVPYTTYLVITDASDKEVWRAIFRPAAKSLSSKDRLYVIALCKPYQGYGSDNMLSWFDQHLPKRIRED